MAHAATPEQQAIIDAVSARKNTVINAGAGSGKTTTLRMIAESDPRRRYLYVAYNRAIADDAQASFPRCVRCRTAHALANRAVLTEDLRKRLGGRRVPAYETARILRIGRGIALPDRTLTAEQIARLVIATVGRFCRSADPEIGPRHVPSKPGLDTDAALAILRQILVPLARRAWEDITSPHGRLWFTHDHYLKMWQLTKPVIDADVILFDEAQDADPVIADVVAAQPVQKVMVGDQCQAIYGWRGAIDAMAKFPADARLTLSQSFRFGPAIASEANKWLDLLNAPLRIRGFDTIPSVVAHLDQADAVLCRSNAEAVSQVMVAAEQGRKPALVGGGDEIRSFAEAADQLRQGQQCTWHPELMAFRTWMEVQEYAEHDPDGSDLKVKVALIDKYGSDLITSTMDDLVPEGRADVVISTAHKAKGREWNRVLIASDFHPPKEEEDGAQADIPREDMMLAYVAVTRARRILDREGLAWVDRWHTAAVSR